MATITDIFATNAPTVELTLDEERSLIAEALLGNQRSSERLLIAYGPALRAAVATHRAIVGYQASPEDVEDMQQQAVIGFYAALQAFDPTRHERLAAVVKENIHAGVREHSAQRLAIYVPERTLTRFFGILRRAGGDVTVGATIAPEYGMRSDTFSDVLAAVRYVEGIIDDEPLGVIDPLRPVDDVDARVMVKHAFEALEGDDTAEKVVRLAYGFSDYEPVADGEVAYRLGLSRPKVQRTRTAALTLMRNHLGVDA